MTDYAIFPQSKVYSDFQRKEITPRNANNQSGWKSDGPGLLRFPTIAICISSCYFPFISCPSAHSPLSEARGHCAPMHTGSPRDPDDPAPAGCSLPPRRTGVIPLKPLPTALPHPASSSFYSLHPLSLQNDVVPTSLKKSRPLNMT